MIEKLGFSSNDRLIIINADDFGISHSTNQACMNMFLNQSISSASIMMPCVAAEEAAQFCKHSKEANVGIHLTLTSSENCAYRPVFQEYPLHSLIQEDGFLPNEVSMIEKYANPDQVALELDAQIKFALSLGVDLTHLDNHAGSLMGLITGRDFLEITFDLCVKYGLPFHLPKKTQDQPFFSRSQRELFKKRIESATNRGIMLIDNLIAFPYHLEKGENYESLKAKLINVILHIKPGITQITIHPALISDELKKLTSHFEKREMEYKLFNDQQIKKLFETLNIKIISWRHIRDLQRSLD